MAVAYVREAGVSGGTSFSMDIGSAATDRLVVVFAGEEAIGTDLTSVTVDGKNCTLIAREEVTDDSPYAHFEGWYVDEDILTTSSGTVTVQINGGDTGWGASATLYTGVTGAGVNDFGVYENGTDATTSTVTGIDCSENGLVVTGAYIGDPRTFSSATSPLTVRGSIREPSTAEIRSLSGIESSAQVNKSYSVVYTSNYNRTVQITATWDEKEEEEPPPPPPPGELGSTFKVAADSKYGNVTIGNNVVNVFANSSTLKLSGNASLSATDLKFGNASINSVVNSTGLYFDGVASGDTQGMVLLDSGAIGSGSTLEFDLSSWYDQYSGIRLEIDNARNDTNGKELHMRFSNTAGVSWDSSSNYEWLQMENDTGSNVDTGNGGDSYMFVSSSSCANVGLQFWIELYDMANTVSWPQCMMGFSDHGQDEQLMSMGFLEVAKYVDAVQLYFTDSSNWVATGNYRIYGYAN